MNDDLISRISLKQSIAVSAILKDKKTLEQIIDEEPTVDAVPVIRCKDCKHRPKGTGANHDLEFPDYVCPCQCTEDGWYSWKPKDDWFCADGERRMNMAVSKAVVPMLTGEAAQSFRKSLDSSRIKPYSDAERKETDRRIIEILEKKRASHGERKKE